MSSGLSREQAAGRSDRAGVWARRVLSAPGLAALWFTFFPPAIFIVGLVVFCALLPEVGVALEDRSSIDARGVGAAVPRSLAYFGFALLAGPFTFSKVPGGLLVRWAIALLLLGGVAGVGLRADRWKDAHLGCAVLLAFVYMATFLAAAIASRLSARLTALAWRAASRNGVISAIVGPGGLVAALLSGFALVGGCIALCDDSEVDDTFLPKSSGLGQVGDLVFFAAEDARETNRAQHMLPSSDRPGWLSHLSLVPSAYAGFEKRDACLIALHQRARDEGDSKIDQAARYLRRRAGLSFDEARDHAADKALAVCTSSEVPLVSDRVRAYYWRAIQNLRTDLLRKAARQPRVCSFTERHRDGLEDRRWARRRSEAELRQCVDAARCRLADADQRWLNLCVEFSTREIEARTGVSKSKANRACQKAKDKFKSVFSRVCG